MGVYFGGPQECTWGAHGDVLYINKITVISNAMHVFCDCSQLSYLHEKFTYVFGHEVVSIIATGIALQKLDWVVQGFVRSCSGGLFSQALLGNSASN